MNSYDIIRRPILTEKSYDGISNKTYTFEVAKSANKVEIKKAVEEIFGVKVTDRAELRASPLIGKRLRLP